MTRTSNDVQHLGETGGRIMKFLKPCVFLGLLAILAIWISSPRAETLIPDVPHSYPADLLAHIRAAAKAVPGPLPIRINFIKIAESHRPLSDIVVGGSQQDYVSARTAFQVAFPGGWVMIDSGMDETVHKFFGFGRAEPYWADRNALLQQALTAAKLIVVTHEHGDHVAGVIRTDARDEIAAKTLLTRAQVQTLTTYPQMPEIRLTPEMARRYMVVDYESYLPVAPGIVLIKAPGHTPGHQMVYVRLASDREYLLIGDVGWTLDNVKQLKLRPEATMRRIGESAPALMFELTWIKEVMDREGLIVIPSHDDILLKDLTAKQLIGGELAVQ
jgi:glyoxylase-like metal-dependent hydrolase (beta-lactamase superfamily II)